MTQDMDELITKMETTFARAEEGGNTAKRTEAELDFLTSAEAAGCTMLAILELGPVTLTE